MEVPHYYFGCVLLPNNANQILILSTVPGGNEARADIYDIMANTWRVTGSSVYARAGASLVSLGNIVFVIGGN